MNRVLAWLLVIPAVGAAQEVGVNAGATASTTLGTRAKLTVPIVLDVSAAGGTNLSALQSALSWNTSRLTFDSLRVAATGWAQTQTSAATGTMTFNASGATAPANGATLVNAYFTAATSAGGARVTLGPYAALNQSAANVLSQLRSRGVDVCVVDRWGDANDDASVDIIDAQQIARYGVGLSVANVTALVARGDVNVDNAVNVIDAQQIARFSVSLSAVPRINTLQTPAAGASIALNQSAAQSMNIGDALQFVATPRDGTSADLTGCAGVNWSSSNTSVATVTGDGRVTAIANGSTTITAALASNGAITASVAVTVAPVTTALLHVSGVNSRYFTDATGRAVYLTGSHTWNNLQDATNNGLPFAWSTFLDFLVAQHHNFTRLWTWEHTWWPDANSRYTPMPFARTGPGLAVDGLAKFDLTQYDATYFDRVRQRAIDAAARGIYVSIMLFNGWSVEDKGGGSPWAVNMFSAPNNVNGIEGDANADGQGTEAQTLQIAAINTFQDAYVRHLIDAVNDLDNVLYEVSNESHGGAAALAWQAHIIQVIKTYEAGKAKQHPVGMTAFYPSGSDADLLASTADFISPQGGGSIADTPAVDGTKVVLLDTDHICGICGDGPWVWKSLTRGVNPTFMDVYDGSYGPVGGSTPNDPNWVATRLNLGYALTYANRASLITMTPHGELSSTGYCLANPAAQNAQYLIYAPSGGSVTVNLSAASGNLAVEWFFPGTGLTMAAGTTTGGGSRTLSAPAAGAAVLYIH